MEAITREEKIMSGENLTPITRKEMFLAKLVGKEIETPFPITRMEKIMNGDQLTPITREEMFLAKSTGQDVKTPTPITRREMFLSKIGGGSGSEETKYYTVNFYNGDELLQTVSIPYGGNATYTGDEPVKEGEWAFTGFVPDGTNITADTDCHAQFRSTALYSAKLVERKITEYASDTLTIVGECAFRECNSLTTVYLPSVTNVKTRAFYGCTALTTVDLASATRIEGDYVFYACSALTTLILRSGTRCSLSDASTSFTATPIKNGTGYIYVPSALMDTYKSTSGWINFANQFRALEDYPEICGGEE